MFGVHGWHLNLAILLPLLPIGIFWIHSSKFETADASAALALKVSGKWCHPHDLHSNNFRTDFHLVHRTKFLKFFGKKVVRDWIENFMKTLKLHGLFTTPLKTNTNERPWGFKFYTFPFDAKVRPLQCFDRNIFSEQSFFHSAQEKTQKGEHFCTKNQKF